MSEQINFSTLANVVPVYPSRDKYESRIYNKYNQLIMSIVGDEHFSVACLTCHLINQYFGVEPTHYYPTSGRVK